MSMERWTDARPPLPATGKQLDVYDRQLDPRRFRYLATRVVGFLALIILSLIFIAAALLVGFTTVWLAAALVTTDVTVRPSFGFRPRARSSTDARVSLVPPAPAQEYTGKAIFRNGGGGSGVAEEVCPESYCFDASSLPFLVRGGRRPPPMPGRRVALTPRALPARLAPRVCPSPLAPARQEFRRVCVW